MYLKLHVKKINFIRMILKRFYLYIFFQGRMKEKKASQESQSRAMLYIQIINKYMKFKLMFVFSSASRKAAELF